MEILVDALVYNAQPAGVGHYIGRLLSAYASRFPSDQLTALVASDAAIDGVATSAVLSASPSSWRRLWYEQRALPRWLTQHRFDVVHFPDYQQPRGIHVPTVMTVHDLVAFKFPKAFPPAQRVVKQILMKRSVPLADHIIVPSESTKRDLMEVLSVDEDRITVIWHGVCVPGGAAVMERDRPYFLFVGTLEPRKNLVRLIQAYYQAFLTLHGDLPDLVIAGKTGWLYRPIFDEVHRLGLQDRVVFLGYVREDDVWKWYRGAVAFCFPTLYEGFGMPVLEAMAVACPVIAANRGAVFEIAKGHAVLVDPDDVDSITGGLLEVLQNSSEVRRLAETAQRFALAQTWTRAAEQTRMVYEKVAAP